MAHWAPACHHALLLSQPWASHPEGEWWRGKQGYWRGGGGGIERKTGGGQEGKEEKEEEECRRRRGERKDVAWALGARQVTLPFLHSVSPLLPNPSPAASLYTMAASLLKFHVIGSRAWSFVLPQCPGSGACCRGDTLCKLKAGKPFLLSLASEKGRKVPPYLFFSIAPFLPISPLYQNRRKAVKPCQAPLDHFGL